MIKELLPIGSVILLKGASKKLVIMGIIQQEEGGDGKLYDYMGVPYPEGFLGKGANFLFNHDDINDVIFRGYESPEREGFIGLLEQIGEEALKQGKSSVTN